MMLFLFKSLKLLSIKNNNLNINRYKTKMMHKLFYFITSENDIYVNILFF